MKRLRIGCFGLAGFFFLLFVGSMLASPYFRAKYSPMQNYLYKRDGFYLVRYSKEHIWLTWWFESGVSISATQNLRQFNPLPFPDIEMDEGSLKIYRLTPTARSWMLDLSGWSGTPFTYASLVNPKNRNAEDDIRTITRLASHEPKDFDAISKLAARHFVFLGWTVQNEAQARALRDALAVDWNLDRSRPIHTTAGTLYPIAQALLKKAGESPEEIETLRASSSSIPILMENVDSREGHPSDSMHVLYLDGHIDDIPFGTRFPATRDFFDSIRFEN